MGPDVRYGAPERRGVGKLYREVYTCFGRGVGAGGGEGEWDGVERHCERRSAVMQGGRRERAGGERCRGGEEGGTCSGEQGERQGSGGYFDGACRVPAIF